MLEPQHPNTPSARSPQLCPLPALMLTRSRPSRPGSRRRARARLQAPVRRRPMATTAMTPDRKRVLEAEHQDRISCQPLHATLLDAIQHDRSLPCRHWPNSKVNRGKAISGAHPWAGRTVPSANGKYATKRLGKSERGVSTCWPKYSAFPGIEPRRNDRSIRQKTLRPVHIASSMSKMRARWMALGKMRSSLS